MWCAGLSVKPVSTIEDRANRYLESRRTRAAEWFADNPRYAAASDAKPLAKDSAAITQGARDAARASVEPTVRREAPASAPALARAAEV